MGANDIEFSITHHDDIIFFSIHSFQHIVNHFRFSISADLTGIAADHFHIFRNIKVFQNAHGQIFLLGSCHRHAFAFLLQFFQHFHNTGEHFIFKKADGGISFTENSCCFLRFFGGHSQFLCEGFKQRRAYDKAQILKIPHLHAFFLLHILYGTDDPLHGVCQCAVQIK